MIKTVMGAAAVALLLTVNLTACSDSKPEVSHWQDVSDAPQCADVLAEFGHGEANYEKAIVNHPSCIGDEGSEVMYYEFLDGRDIKYPGWPN